MICRSSTRNPVQVRAVQFYSSLVDTNGCGHVWRDRGRVRPATAIGLRPAAAQLRPENSAGCGFGQMSRILCHALVPIIHAQCPVPQYLSIQCSKLLQYRNYRCGVLCHISYFMHVLVVLHSEDAVLVLQYHSIANSQTINSRGNNSM
jgi:hypothetical protein